MVMVMRWKNTIPTKINFDLIMCKRDIVAIVAMGVLGVAVLIGTINNLINDMNASENSVWSYTSGDGNPFDSNSVNYVIERRRKGWVVAYNETNKAERITNTVFGFIYNKEYVGSNKNP